MAKWDGILRKKSAYWIIGIAIICLILGPILGVLLSKVPIYERYPQVIQEDSVSSIRNSFTQQVTLAKDQKLIIEISEFYPNSSITIKILSSAVYEQAVIADSTPGSTSGLYFVYSQFLWGTTYVSSTTSLSLPSSFLYAYIEFMGDRSGTRLISWPGNYVVVVYGTNSGGPTDLDVLFDITIKVDGPGELLSNILILAGIILLIFYFIAAVVVILRKNYFR